MLPLDSVAVFLVGCLVGWGATAYVQARRVRAAAQQHRDHATASVACTVCQRGFPDRETAREHCRDAHNAPDAAAADHLLTGEGDG